MKKPISGFAMLILCLAAQPVQAQGPIDSAAVVLRLAEDLQANGKNDLAEALFRLVINRFPESLAADSARLRLSGVGRARERSGGLGAMTAWGGLYGAWVGVAIPAALAADDPSAFGAGMLIGAPVGIMIARSAARSAGVTGGQARAIGWGSIWGSFQGLGWQKLLNLGDHQVTQCFPGAPCFTFTEESATAPFAMSLVGGAAGIGTAAVLGHNKDISSGTVAAIQWGSIWGSWFGFAVSALAGQEEGDGPLASTLVGGNIGLITSAALAHRWNLTSGRPWLVSAIGLAGLLAGIGLDLIIEPDDIQGAIVPPLAGSIVGLLTGVSMTRPKGASLSIVSSEREHAALLQFAHRKLVVGEPVVIPTIQPKAAVGGKIGWQPAFRIPLVSVALP